MLVLQSGIAMFIELFDVLGSTDRSSTSHLSRNRIHSDKVFLPNNEVKMKKVLRHFFPSQLKVLRQGHFDHICYSFSVFETSELLTCRVGWCLRYSYWRTFFCRFVVNMLVTGTLAANALASNFRALSMTLYPHHGLRNIFVFVSVAIELTRSNCLDIDERSKVQRQGEQLNQTSSLEG